MPTMTDDNFSEITDLVENSDGSVDIYGLEETALELGEFTENLALAIPKAALDQLGTKLAEAVDRDREARSKRDKQYEDGIRRTGLGDDAPGGATFAGASTVVHPALAEACVDFAARAIKELFPPQGPVKTAIIGTSNEEATDRAERKRTFMNYQLTTQMPEYRSELEQLLTQLPLGGSQFQKFWYDERFKRPVSEFIPIDDILIPYAAKSFYTAQRVTHVQHVTELEFDERVSSGLYIDLSVSATGTIPDQTASAEASDKIEGKEADAYNEDGIRDIYEIYCWEKVNDPLVDAYAPYIITVDSISKKVLAVYRNWAEDDESFEKLDWLVEWKFIPWRGAYAIGFPQLIGGLSGAATGALRALLDSAHINNTPALVKLGQGSRTPGQNNSIDPTGVSEIQGPVGVDDIRKLMMAIPYNQPSPILFQLLGWLTDAAKQVVRTAEGSIANVGDRTPVGTTQAMIEQGSVIYSAIHARLHESQKRALQILCRINKTWLDEESEIEELGKLVIRRDDFIGSLDIIPVSDPAIFSEAQRYAQNQSVLQMAAMDVQDPSVPWNKIAIRRRALKQMRIDNIDELLPLPPKPVTADVLTEDMAALNGATLQAAPQQDHMAHIHGHLMCVHNPLNLENPFVPPQALLELLRHTQVHIQMYQQNIYMGAAQQMSMQMQHPSPEGLLVHAKQQVLPQLVQQLQPIIQLMTQLQQVIQKRMPPPPMPPEIQATLKIAEMDNQRKTQLDQATIANKQVEQQASQEHEKALLTLQQAQQAFENMLEEAKLTIEEQNNQLTAQVDLLNNKADNQQKQITDLLKNRDDNETKLEIALQDRLNVIQTEMVEPLKKLQEGLSKLHEAKSEEALKVVTANLPKTGDTSD